MENEYFEHIAEVCRHLKLNCTAQELASLSLQNNFTSEQMKAIEIVVNHMAEKSTRHW